MNHWGRYLAALNAVVAIAVTALLAVIAREVHRLLAPQEATDA